MEEAPAQVETTGLDPLEEIVDPVGQMVEAQEETVDHGHLEAVDHGRVVTLDQWGAVVALDPWAAVVGPGIMVAPHLEDHHPDSLLSLVSNFKACGRTFLDLLVLFVYQIFFLDDVCHSF